jgi:hypothetical protein
MDLAAWGSEKRAWWLVFVILFVLLGLVMGVVTVYRTYRGSNDFDTYYQAGEALLEGESLYQAGAGESPFLYPPIAACFFALFALLPLGAAAFLWNALNVIFFVRALVLIESFLDLRYRELWYAQGRLARVDLALFTVILFAFLLDNLAMAQVNILVFYLVMAALILWKQAKPFAAGLVLSCAVLLKLTPALFLLYFAVKRSGKVLGGALAGGILFAWLVPGLVLGFGLNRAYFIQWFGSMVRPMVSSLKSAGVEQEHQALVPNMRLRSLLAEKNQSLEATLTRWFLANRHDLEENLPMGVFLSTRRYRHLPVIGGGLPRDALTAVVRVFQAFILLTLCCLWAAARREDERGRRALEVSLIFLSMTLLAPLARSHQFISWSFAFSTILWLANDGADPALRRILRSAGRWALVFYVLQAVPYGKAAGMGTWANLVLWIGFAWAAFEIMRRRARPGWTGA